ncbi:hypothetical protein ACB092_01G092000 [Castanea dentata]
MKILLNLVGLEGSRLPIRPRQCWRCGYELRRCGAKERSRWGKREKRDLRENEGKNNSNGGGYGDMGVRD